MSSHFLDNIRKTIINDIPLTDTGTTSYNARFPYNVGETNEYAKFCIFVIIGRSIGNRRILKGYVQLPLPQEINEGLNVGYNTSSFGVVGAAAVGSLRDNISGQSIGELKDNAERILKKGVGSFNIESFFKVATNLALKGTPGLKAAVNNSSTTIENPYMTSTFSGVGFRQFNFNFNLIPKNQEDSIQLSNLINIFKTSMMPRDKVEINDNLLPINTGLQYLPDIFDVFFYPTTLSFSQTRSGNNMLRIRDAVLTKFDVNLSPDTPWPVFHESDDAPFSATINLSLKETVIYTKERCEDDYDDLLRGTQR